MLQKLKIQNYALIDNIEIYFQHGLSIITGETGAGKSIIMGALALVAGGRADSKIISKGAKKCVIEAEFFLAKLNLQEVFDEVDVDYDDITTIRREVADTGKSRAFINDTPCNLTSLKTLVSHLIDIHSQHANLLLNDAQFQVNILDSYANTSAELQTYSAAYKNYISTKKELESLQKSREDMMAEKDYLEFQYKQLDEASLIDGEQEQLEAEAKTLEHAEEIKTEFYGAYTALGGAEMNVEMMLRDAVQMVRRVSEYVAEGESYVERLEALRIEVKDLGAEFEGVAEDMDFDPQRKLFVQERLDSIYSLQQKHRVDNVAELIALRDEFSNKLQRMVDYDIDVEKLQKQCDETRKILDAAAATLTSRRKAVVGAIEEQLVEKLVFLGMDNARCAIEVSRKADYHSSGVDDVAFKFSANKNGDMQAIAAIASGGEMSRVMLSIKQIVASRLLLNTIIFDEIDTGVSGEIAHRMGEMMQAIARDIQVIAITHLPQIASKGQSHYKVYKRDTEDRTITHITQLNTQERVLEIAEMLSGKNPSEAAIANAQSLIQNAQ